jgi:ornithine decarboxylase
VNSIDPFVPEQIRRLVREFGSPLLIIDCARVRSQYRKLRTALPGVDLHYALKPLPHPAVVRSIVELGGWLDLATTGEAQLAQSLGVDPARCIQTHPIKRDRDINNALEYGVRTFVADNPDEVRKFKPHGERAALLLRVSFRAPGAVCDLSRKFGCDPEDAIALARLAARQGVDVQGFSFHVGSQAPDPMKHVEAIEVCKDLLAAARRERLGTLDTLDIGGGFPIDYHKRDAQRGYPTLLRPDTRRAGKTAQACARDRRARTLHRRPQRDRRVNGDGSCAARRALVVLPR